MEMSLFWSKNRTLAVSGLWLTTSSPPATEVFVLNASSIDGKLRYRLRARSLVDRSWKHSNVYSTAGIVEFVVGGEPLRVTVSDVHKNVPLAFQKVNIFKIGSGDALIWEAQAETDASGNFEVDLDGLKDRSTRYVLQTRKYAMLSQSAEISSAGNYTFKIGTLPITIVNGMTGERLRHLAVQLVEKSTSGQLTYYPGFSTDSSGLVVLDPIGLGEGRGFFIRAMNPFGDDRHVFSEVISRPGPLTWVLSPDDLSKPDTVPPSGRFIQPTNGKPVPLAAYEVLGWASDDQAVGDVSLRLETNSQSIQATVDFDPDSSLWRAQVPGEVFYPRDPSDNDRDGKRTRISMLVLSRSRFYRQLIIRNRA